MIAKAIRSSLLRRMIRTELCYFEQGIFRVFYFVQEDRAGAAEAIGRGMFRSYIEKRGYKFKSLSTSRRVVGCMSSGSVMLSYGGLYVSKVIWFDWLKITGSNHKA